MPEAPKLDARTLKLMGALAGMPPKQHEDMKLGKPRGTPSKKRAKTRAKRSHP